MSFYSLSNVADSNRAAKGLSRVFAVYTQNMGVNFGGFMLLCHISRFLPSKKSFPFLRSFSLCGGDFLRGVPCLGHAFRKGIFLNRLTVKYKNSIYFYTCCALPFLRSCFNFTIFSHGLFLCAIL